MRQPARVMYWWDQPFHADRHLLELLPIGAAQLQTAQCPSGFRLAATRQPMNPCPQNWMRVANCKIRPALLWPESEPKAELVTVMFGPQNCVWLVKFRKSHETTKATLS